MKIYKEKFQNAIKIYPCKKTKKLFHKIEIVFFLLQDFDPHKRNNKLIINVVDFLLLLLFIRMETKKNSYKKICIIPSLLLLLQTHNNNSYYYLFEFKLKNKILAKKSFSSFFVRSK